MEQLLKQVRDHPELIAIGLEIALNPSRRRHYSPLVLTLVDVAMQDLLTKIAGGPAPAPDEKKDFHDI
jgi:hypothetical protein